MIGNKQSPLVVIALIGMLFCSAPTVSAQDPAPECDYFADTGQYVCDEFLNFFRERGGTEIFGLPITRAFDDPSRGMQVQYFQNFRMEWHPENPDPYKVQLGLLADELGHNRFPPADDEQIPAYNSNLHHYFPETGHVVSYAFLDYFRENGGIDIFGYPRSEFMYEDGHIVQYFQRTRMVWHPEVISGPQMRLTPLGEVYVEQFVPERYQQPEAFDSSRIRVGADAPTPTTTPLVTKLYVSASVRHVITGREGQQTVFVYVNDQQQNPVEGAEVKMIVRYPSEQDQHYDFEKPTNPSGFTVFGFKIKSTAPGQKVIIDITVTYDRLTSTTQTFFLPWW